MSTTSYVLIDHTDKSYAIEGDIFKTFKLGHGSRATNIKNKKTGEGVPGVYFPKTNLQDIINVLKTNNIDLIIPDHETSSEEKKPSTRKPNAKKSDNDSGNETDEPKKTEEYQIAESSGYEDDVWGIPKKRIANINTSESYDETAFKKLRSIRIQKETNNLSIDGLIIYQYEGNLYNVLECSYNCKNREADPVYIIYSNRYACAIRFSLHDDYEKEDSMNKSAMDSYRKSEIRNTVRFPDYCNKNLAYIYYVIDKMSKYYFIPHRLYVSDPDNDGKKNYSFVNIIATFITDDREIPKNQEGIYNWVFGMVQERFSFFDIITSVLVNIGTKK